MHASTTKDMVLSGDWITPTFNGKNFYDKPILYNWFAALSFMILGFTEFAARLPAALQGFGCVMITYLLGRLMFGPMVGFLGGVILATSPEYVILSRVVVHDISLAFFVTLSLFFFYLGFTRARYRKTYFLLSYTASGFAVLAKGPLGVALPGLIVGLFLALKGKLRFLKEMRLGWGTLVFLVVTAPWYVLISLKNSDYAGYFFLQQNLQNFFSSELGHPKPFYYYIPILLGGFFPWSFFLPLALIRVLRVRLKAVDDRALFLVVWFGAIFLFFSVASSKLPPYILPSFPAAALLVGVLWHDLLSAPTVQLGKGFLYSFVPIVVILSLALVYILIIPPTRLASKYGIDLTQIYFLASNIAAIAVLSFFMCVRKNYKTFFSANVTLIVSAVILFLVLIVPSINPYRSSKQLAQRLDALVPLGEKFVFYRRIRDSALFYTNRKGIVLYIPRQVIQHMTSNKKAYCVIQKKHFAELEKLREVSEVVYEEGRDLIISSKTSA
jgi:4-amino-4-deoxy-L-arabinose transferase-like glycosyltransferase